MRALTVILLLALAACARPARSPVMMACAGPAPTPASLQMKANACTSLLATAQGDDLVVVLRSRGEAYRQQADNAAALADFNRALTLKRDDAGALDGRGLVYMAEGDLARAAGDFDAAIRASPGDSAGYNNRGVVEQRRGDYADALRDENRAIELGPRVANHWANRGLVLLGKRRFELALADFADALRLDPRLITALDGRGEAEVAKGDAADAVLAYDQAGNVYFEAQQYPRALAEDDRALAIKSDDAEALNNRCWTRAVADLQLPLALADCEHSLQVRPGDAATLDSDAFVHFRMGEFSQAVAGYDAALAKNPKLAPSMFMRGVAKLHAGDADGGQADIDSAEQMDSGVAGQFASYGVTPPAAAQ
jgi:tetratricopeptide (TPR) repeat protein